MKKFLLIAAFPLLVACAPTMYWNKSGVNLAKTSEDLLACRMEGAKANQGGHIIYSAQQIEHPCMAAKGYTLSRTPPNN